MYIFKIFITILQPLEHVPGYLEIKILLSPRTDKTITCYGYIYIFSQLRHKE